jgi:putative membrane-bound dehydrogenase-like protein
VRDKGGMSRRNVAASLAAWVLAGLLALAAGDEAAGGGEGFPEPYDSGRAAGGMPPPAAEAVEMIELPEGFRAQVFAAEPEVRNPIGMAWDHRGRVWVAENYTYAEREKRFDLELRDRVIVLEDTVGDGVADSRRVFVDDVQMLTSVAVGRGGVWLMCPPELLFVPDADLDGVADGPAEVVLDGFTVAQANYHNFANGLKWGPDGWLYGRCGHSCPAEIGAPGTAAGQRVPMRGGIWRYQPESGRVEVLCHGTTNPWGHDWDRHGEGFFINTVNGHLWHIIAGAHYREHHGVSPNPMVYERIDTHADHYHFDTGQGWQKSRDGAADDFGGGHAHIGMMIYQAGGWPEEYRDKLFTWNMHGRRANVERLEREGSGFVGRHGPDLFRSADPWFQGLEIAQGPDGSALVLDWSDTGECHGHMGIHRSSGRIYRLSHERGGDLAGLGAGDRADLERMDLGAVGRLLRSDNVWQARLCLERLAGGAGTREGLDEMLRDMVAGDGGVELRLRGLWALWAVGGVDAGLLEGLLIDREEAMRAWALRLLGDGWPLDSIMGPMEGAEYPELGELGATLVAMAEGDGSGLVRLALASLLQRLAPAARVELAAALVGREEDAADHNLPALVWYGLIPVAGGDLAGLMRVAEACRWPDSLRWMARSVAERSGEGSRDAAAALESMIGLGQRREGALRLAILRGLDEGWKGRQSVAAPGGWEELAEAVLGGAGGAEELGLVRALAVLFGDGRALEELERLVMDGGADIGQRRAALETVLDAGGEGLRELCGKALAVSGLEVTAIRGLARAGGEGIAERLIELYPRLPAEAKRAAIEALVGRADWARVLLGAIGAGRVVAADLTPYHVRAVRAHGDVGLIEDLGRVWGGVREAAEDKRAEMEAYRERLTPEYLAGANLGMGRLLYQAACASCHRLYGDGGELGPDLTGAGRFELDYLLENLIDPSAVVAADYRVSVLRLGDGRVLSGVVIEERGEVVRLRQQEGEELVAVGLIEERELLDISMMPEGLLQALGEEGARDLIGYLMHPRQVELGGEGE